MSKSKSNKYARTRGRRRIRLALIGAGVLANNMHYPCLKSFRDVQIVGICDLNLKKAQTTAAKFGIEKTYDDYRRMLDETKPEAVYLIVPPHLAFEPAADILEREKHLFIEKPVVPTVGQLEALARMADKRKLVTAVGYQRRYHPLLVQCWERLRKTGPVQQAVASFYKFAPPQECHPYYRGAMDILRCDAIHAVDALRYYCGLSEVMSVTAQVRTLDAWYATNFIATIRFENDAVGVLMANWRAGRRLFQFEFHTFGASAFVDADGTGEVWRGTQDEPVLRSNQFEAAGNEAAYIRQGFYAVNRAFIDAIRSDCQLHNNLRDAVKSLKLCDRIYESACAI